MLLLKKIINITLYFFIFLRILKKENNSLRILMFHDINDLEKFEKILIHLKKEWKFISPDLFFKIYRNNQKIKKKLILLTFDDGFKSNIKVAEKILSKHNIKAIFFIPFHFINLKKVSDRRKFIRNNLKIKNLTKNLYNMNLIDLKRLIKLKHKIGAHTYSHKDLKFTKNIKILNYEIIASANKFESILSKKINLFAFNFGRLKNISPTMMKIANRRFDFLFTGVRGKNSLNSKILFRDNINQNDNIFDITVYLNGTFDFIYKKERTKLKSFLRRL
jgi:peptidoglycan/xylan/chitin deacetylase (PgdA/CDA1 family)